MPVSRRPVWGAVAGVLLLAALLRFYSLGHQSLWLDEAISVHDVAGQATLSEALAANVRFDTNPPLYNLALHVWCKAGSAEWWVRLPSALLGIAAVGLAMATLFTLGFRRAALVAGLVCALAPFQVWYSQEARYYALLLALSTLGFYAVVQWTRAFQRGWLVVATVAETAAVYTHLFGWCLVFGATLTVWGLCRRRREALLQWGLAQAVVVLAFVPWLPYLLAKAGANLEHGIAGYGGGFDPLRLGYALYVLGVGFGAGPSLWQLHGPSPTAAFLAQWPLILPAAAVLGAVVAVGLLRVVQDVRLRWVVLPWLLVPVLGLAAAAAVGRVAVTPRYLAGAAPALAIVLALGLAESRPKPLRLALTVVFVACCAVSLGRTYWVPEYGKADWRGLYALLARERQADDVVLATVDLPLRYYSRGALDPIDVSGPLTGERDVALSAALRSVSGTVWLVYTRPWDFDPDGSLLRHFDERYTPRGEWDFHGIRLHAYQGAARDGTDGRGV